MVRYKVGKFDYPVYVSPGDTFKLTLTEHAPNGVEHKQLVQEEITAFRMITTWIMFDAPGIGFGGMFGGDDLEDRIGEVFVDPVKIDREQSLFGIEE